MLFIPSCRRIAKHIRRQFSIPPSVRQLPPLSSRAQTPLNPASAQVVNQHLLADLTRAGLWTRDLKNELVAANGSVQVRCRLFYVIVVPTLRRYWSYVTISGGVHVPGSGTWAAAAPCCEGTWSLRRPWSPGHTSPAVAQYERRLFIIAGPGHPGSHEGAVQDGVGDQAEGAHMNDDQIDQQSFVCILGYQQLLGWDMVPADHRQHNCTRHTCCILPC